MIEDLMKTHGMEALEITRTVIRTVTRTITRKEEVTVKGAIHPMIGDTLMVTPTLGIIADIRHHHEMGPRTPNKTMEEMI